MAWVIVSSRTRAEILVAAWLMVLPGAEAAPLPLDSWQSLHQARLAEAAALDFEGAERSYRQLIQNLAADDPLREEALYSLARLLYNTGRRDAARDMLLEGIRNARARPRFLDMMQLIELEQNSVTNLPTLWNFADGGHGLLHPWGYQDKGSLRLEAAIGDGALAWQTRVQPGEDDQLVMGFDLGESAMRGLRLQLGASNFEGWVEVLVFDDRGTRWTWAAGHLRARTDGLVAFELPLEGFRRSDGAEGRLDGTRLHRLALRDVSAFRGVQPGTHDLIIDQFEIY